MRAGAVSAWLTATSPVARMVPGPRASQGQSLAWSPRCRPLQRTVSPTVTPTCLCLAFGALGVGSPTLTAPCTPGSLRQAWPLPCTLRLVLSACRHPPPLPRPSSSTTVPRGREGGAISDAISPLRGELGLCASPWLCPWHGVMRVMGLPLTSGSALDPSFYPSPHLWLQARRQEEGRGCLPHGRSLALWPRPAWMPPLLSTLSSRVTTVTPVMTTWAKRKPWRPRQVLGPSPHREHGNDGLGPGRRGGRSASQPWGLRPFKHTSPSLAGGRAGTTPASPALGTLLTWSGTTHGALREPRRASPPFGSGPGQARPPRETDSLVTTPRAGWCLSVTRCSQGPLPGGVGCVPAAGSGSPGVTATRGRRGTSPAPSACPALAPISITHIPTTPPGPGAVCGWPRRARPVLLDHREESGPLERVRIKRFQSSCDKTRAGVGVGP